MTSTLTHRIDELSRAGAGCRADDARSRSAEVAARYAVALTPAMAELIDRDDPDDPIARQFVPDARELEHEAGRTRRSDRRRCPSARSKASCIAIPIACC